MKQIILACLLIALCHADVPNFGYGYANTRLSSDALITSSNAHTLSKVWSYTVGGPVMSSPIGGIVRGQDLIFVASYDGYVHALYRTTGALKWKKQLSTYTGIGGSRARTTPALYQDYLILGDNNECTLVAVNASTGAFIWKNKVDSQPYCLFTQSPMIGSDGSIFVGIASNEEYIAGVVNNYPCCKFMGAMFKLSLHGVIQWKFRTIPNNNGASTGYSGAGIWGSAPALDYGRTAVYIATGNNYNVPQSVKNCINAANASNKTSCLDPADYVDSLISLNMNTGSLQWHKKASGPDVWNGKCTGNCVVGRYATDSDFMQGSMLTTIVHNGANLDVVITVQKNGNVWCISRSAPGNIIWKVNVNNCYFSFGSAVDANRVYIASSDGGRGAKMHNGQVCNNGHWVALNKNTGAFVWEKCNPSGGNVHGPVTVVKGGVLFASSLDGTLYALNSATGATLWSQKQSAVIKSSGPCVTNGMVIMASGYRETSGTTQVNAYKTH
jgi:polyvinyl alcohol dehydrogenase (cytochrome)